MIAVGALVSVAAYEEWLRTDNPAWDGALRYGFFFLLGLRGRPLLMRFASWLTPGRALAVVAVWAAVWIGVDLVDGRGQIGVRTCLRLIGTFAGIAAATLVARSAVLRSLGRSTLPIYVTHQLLVRPIAAILAGAALPVGATVLAPILLGVAVLGLTWWWARQAPRLGLGWWYAVPLRLTALVQGSRTGSPVRLDSPVASDLARGSSSLATNPTPR